MRRPTSRPKPASRPRRAVASRGLAAGLGAGLVTLAILAALLIAAATVVYVSPGPAAKTGGETVVMLRKGAGVAEIGGALKRAGVIRSDLAFTAAAQLTRSARRMRAGEYAFPSRACLAGVIGQIRSGRIVRHHITIAEGLTSQQAVDILNRSPLLEGETSTPAEGAILPETYEVTRGESRAAVVQRMMNARDHLLLQLWLHRRPGLPYATPGQAVTLASIVEKETALAAERPRVAAAYLNRLRQGMRLEADPTVVYGVSQGMPLGRGLRLSELQADNPYNTYLKPGLPPTPIANPGRASLAAVLDPATTGELFFVANGRGGHVFAATFEEHQKNVAKWRKLEHAPPQRPAPALARAAPAEHR